MHMEEGGGSECAVPSLGCFSLSEKSGNGSVLLSSSESVSYFFAYNSYFAQKKLDDEV